MSSIENNMNDFESNMFAIQLDQDPEKIAQDTSLVGLIGFVNSYGLKDNTPTKETLPLFTDSAKRNLIGRLLTLMDAIIEDPKRRKSVKDLVVQTIEQFDHDCNNQVASHFEELGEAHHLLKAPVYK